MSRRSIGAAALGLLNALAVAPSPWGRSDRGRECERRPLVKGWKLGATAKPPPEMWVPLPQDAAAVAVALEASGALAERVTAGFPFFPFLAPASAPPPIAATASAVTTTMALRLRIPSSLSAVPDLCARIVYRRPAGLTIGSPCQPRRRD